MGLTGPPGFVIEPPGIPGYEIAGVAGAVGPREAVTGQIVVYCGIVTTVTTVEAAGQSVTVGAQETTVNSFVVKTVEVVSRGVEPLVVATLKDLASRS